ncbi:MAG TPA: hypothetical protein VF787_01330 [Thermoanaerobaculia bacterium]
MFDDTHDLIQQMMAAYADDAVSFARQVFSIELNSSPDSIQQVEFILDKLSRSVRRTWLKRLLRLGMSEEQTDTVAKMFGGYIGEIIRKDKGGIWQIIASPTGEGDVVALVNGEDKIFPPAKAYKRLVNGDEDNVWFYYQVLMSGEVYGSR